MRTILFFGVNIIVAIVTLPLLAITYISKSEKMANCAAYIWSTIMLWILGIKINLHGEIDQNEDILQYINHESILDIIVIIKINHGKGGFIAKKEIKKVPILKQWMEFLGCFFLDRNSLKSGAVMVIESVNRVKKGRRVIIFPEGTRSKKDTEYKSGSFKIAEKAKCSITPITIRGTYDLFEGNGNKFKSGQVNIYINERVEYEQYKDLTTDQIMNEVQTKIISN